ncbi:hypothetical protein BH10BDE1_BH10BDE1_30600 [soil metagenome]
MLSRLRKISRRIGSEIGGLMATGKSAKGSTNGKATGKPAVKSGAKPAAKAAKTAAPKPAAKVAGKPAKAAKASKPASAKAGAKVSAKALAKPVVKASAKPVAAKTGKAEVKAPVGKSAGVQAPKKAAAAKANGKAAKLPKSAEELEAVILDGDFAAEEQFAADIASDMAAAETEVADAEPVSPSAALLAVMKPTISDEKAAEKKKKKDDLKIDRNGDMEAQWQSLKEKNKAIKPLNYKMSESFEARTPMLHKVLGWGFIISNQNDRLEVLFQQGIKFLISNYKA